jgi:hypothetical protein
MILQPASSRAQRLETKLKEVQLDDKPQYEALSYAWGDDAPSENLAIDGGVVMINTSLAAALRQFRHPDRPRTLWVDAVCINQSDTREKSRQVAQMADVYRLASRVLIWLGQSTANTSAVFRFLGATAGRAEDFGLEKTLSSWLKFERKLQGNPDDISSLLQASVHTELVDVFSRPWFTRLWIIQEVVLAQASVIHCGAEMLDWDVFSTSMAVLMAAARTAGAPVCDHETFLTAWRIVDLVATRRMGQFTFQMSPYCDVRMTMYRTRYQRCHDERDRVFALQGLGHRGLKKRIQRYPDDMVCELLPDYGKTEAQTFVRFARHVLQQGDLLMLHDAGLHRRLGWSEFGKRRTAEPDVPRTDPRYLPSWVPDLSHPETFESELWNSDDYEAGGSVLRGSPLVGDDQNEVVVCFRSLGQVLLLQHDHNLKPDGQARDLSSVFSRFMANAERYADIDTYFRYATCASPLTEAVVRTMAADGKGGAWTMIFDGPATPEEVMANFAVYKKHSLSPNGEIAQRWANPTSSSTPTDFLAGADAEAMVAWKFEGVMQQVLTGNSFMSTTRGLVGIAPGNAEPGDHVVIVKGLTTPCVLRSVEGTGSYVLVGPCYVHGIMYGEAALDETKWDGYVSLY